MSQAIWRSPLLPFEKEVTSSPLSLPPIGSGYRFKHDLLAYFRGYGPEKLRGLVDQLQRYDFSKARGALIASVPGKQNIQSMDSDHEALWGWPSLRRILSCVPSNPTSPTDKNHQPHIVAQISSVAAVGEKWLTNTFLPALSTQKSTKPPKTSIIFPTPDEIRRSVDGYTAGASIHMKISSPAQAKQLDVLRPMLCHWAGDQKPSASSFFASKSSASAVREAGRRRAAPHIKTYVRFSNTEKMDKIDWAMMTSANLSTQAWGGALSPAGEVRICSYEIGVVVWPALWDDDDDGEEGGGKAEMVPVFKKDRPSSAAAVKTGTDEQDDSAKTLVGWRMPYDLPLVPYKPDEKPWCASEAYKEPDWKGRVWTGNGK